MRLLTTALLIWASVVSYNVGKLLDGIIYPVTTEVQITSVTPYTEKTAISIAGDFIKLRNCQYKRIEWYYGSRDNRSDTSVLVRAFFEDRPTVRPTGSNHFDNLVLFLSESDMQYNSYAYVYHDCYHYSLPNIKIGNIRLSDFGFSLWETKTLFYDSSKNLPI